MKDFSPRQLAVVRKVIDTLFDGGIGPIPEERIVFVLHGLREYVARAGMQTRLAFRAALIVVQLAPFVLLRRMRRFAKIGPADRMRCLLRLEQSRLGLVVVLLKTTLCLHYFEHPDVLARTGYDGEGMLGPAWAADLDTEPPPPVKLPLLSTSASAGEGR